MSTNTAVATRQDTAPAQARPIDTVRAALERMTPQLKMALPRHLTPDRLVRVALTAVQNTPKLLECDRTSLYAAIMTCAQLGLEPDGVLGQAYLIPYGDKVQFIPGYKGLISLARNSGEVVSIGAHEVCERDEFRFAFGLREDLHHVPARGDRGEITHFYAIARFRDGGHHWDVMTREEVDTIRDNSQGYRTAKRFARNGVINSPWAQHYVEMGKKTAIRRIAKYLPLSVQKAAAMADAYDSGRHARMDVHGDIVIDDAPPAAQVGSGPAPSRLERFEATAAGDEGTGGANAAEADGPGHGDAADGDRRADDVTNTLVVELKQTRSGVTDWKAFQDEIGALLQAHPGLAQAIQDANQHHLDDLAKEDAVRRGTVREMFIAAAGGGTEGTAA